MFLRAYYSLDIFRINSHVPMIYYEPYYIRKSYTFNTKLITTSKHEKLSINYTWCGSYYCDCTHGKVDKGLNKGFVNMFHAFFSYGVVKHSTLLNLILNSKRVEIGWQDSILNLKRMDKHIFVERFE